MPRRRDRQERRTAAKGTWCWWASEARSEADGFDHEICRRAIAPCRRNDAGTTEQAATERDAAEPADDRLLSK